MELCPAIRASTNTSPPAASPRRVRAVWRRVYGTKPSTRGLSDDPARTSSAEDELLKSIAAFTNTNDGMIFVGVDDRGHITSLDRDFTQRDRLEQKIRQLVRNRIRPTPLIQVDFDDVRGLVVAKIAVARGEALAYMMGGVIYVRNGSADVQAQSLWAVIRGEQVKVRGRRKPMALLFNLEHPDQLAVVTEVHEDGEDEDEDEELIEDEVDSTQDELQKRFNRMTFVVATKKLEQLPQWVKVTDVFKTDSDAALLKRAGVTGFDDPNYERYSQRLARLRGIRKYMYRMDVLERRLSYDEVTEIFVRVNSLGAKLRSSDLALAQVTAKWRNSLKIFESFQQQCGTAGFELDLGLLLKNLVVFATGQSRFLTVGSLRLDGLCNAGCVERVLRAPASHRFACPVRA